MTLALGGYEDTYIVSILSEVWAGRGFDCEQQHMFGVL
jgi:hypothetical protein